MVSQIYPLCKSLQHTYCVYCVFTSCCMLTDPNIVLFLCCCWLATISQPTQLMMVTLNCISRPSLVLVSLGSDPTENYIFNSSPIVGHGADAVMKLVYGQLNRHCIWVTHTAINDPIL
jgi:hypothetical protein